MSGLAQLVAHRTLGRRVPGTILVRGVVCCGLERVTFPQLNMYICIICSYVYDHVMSRKQKSAKWSSLQEPILNSGFSNLGNLFFPTSDFWGGTYFLIAPFPDRCLLLPFLYSAWPNTFADVVSDCLHS